jgi:hypothetical protein
MLALSLLWLLLGGVSGALALGARLRPALWGPRGRLIMLGVGAAAGLLGGWLGALVLGRLYGTVTALWIAVLVVVTAPWLSTRLLNKRVISPQPAPEQPNAESDA